MKKKQATMRQINAAHDEMKRIYQLKREQFQKRTPRPAWKVETEWTERNLSPIEAWEKKVEGALKPLKERIEQAVYRARMGETSDSELSTIVELMRRD